MGYLSLPFNVMFVKWTVFCGVIGTVYEFASSGMYTEGKVYNR